VITALKISGTIILWKDIRREGIPAGKRWIGNEPKKS
jgi:hypothetical protein